MQQIWNIQRQSLVDAYTLAKETGCSLLLAELLLARGIDNPEEAKLFLTEGGPYHLPQKLSGIKEAVARIIKAIVNEEKIVIYGDYDVDGITATALLVDLLERAGANVSYYLPERLIEGYGLNLEAISYLEENKTQLIITVDCGITSIEEAKVLKDIGIDLIITDHHTPLADLPEAIAIINPHLNDYPAPLCGAGVAYKLAQALSQEVPTQFQLTPRQIQLAALGTVADIVDLKDENRRIVKQGIFSMNKEPIPGIVALKEVANLNDRKIDASTIAFVLAPRVNATGRLGSADDGVKLFLSDTLIEAMPIAKKLDQMNVERRQIEDNILQEAILQAEEQLDHKAIVVAGENWHSGVIGIVASKLVDLYYRPTVVIELSDGECRGSCRSIENFNMYKALEATKEYLLKFGGHKMAAGLSVEKNNLEDFKRAFLNHADTQLTEKDLYPRVYIDTEVNIPIDLRLIEELSLLEPCGAGNPSPLFAMKEGLWENAYLVGANKKHLKFQLIKDNVRYDAIAFQMADRLQEFEKSLKLDFVFVPEVNEYMGKRSVSLNVKSLRKADKTWECSGEEQVWRFWSSLNDGELSYVAKSYLFGKKEIGLPALSLIHNMKILQKEHYLNPEINFVLEKRPKKELDFYPKVVKEKNIGFVIDSQQLLQAFLGEGLKGLNGQKECTLSFLPENYWWWRLFWEVAQSLDRVGLMIDKKDFSDLKRKIRLKHPSDNDLRRIYLFIKNSSDDLVWRGSPMQAAIDMENRFGIPFTAQTLEKAFNIFSEMGLLKYVGLSEQGPAYQIIEPREKLDLEDSLSYNEGMFIWQELEQYAKEVSSL